MEVSMAERYEDQYRRDRGYRRDDRGFMERAGDEVRSWFGDEDAERRRQMDDRDRGYDRGSSGGSRGNERSFPGYYDRGSYYRPVDRDSLGDRGQAFSERDRGGSGERDYGNQGYGERGYGDRGYGERGSGGYGASGGREDWDRYGGSGSGGYGAGGYGSGGYGSGRVGSGAQPHRDYTDRSSYRSDGWRGLNYPASQVYGNRDMPEQRNYAGHGPRGYQRSDQRVNEDVCDRLCDAPDVDARNIEVSVSNGEVTLNGSVSDRDQKRRAEDLIEQVSGVREVRNNLRVARAGEWSGGETGQSTAAAPSGNVTGATTGGAGATGTSGTTGTAGAAGTAGEQPGNVIGVGGGAPDRASSAGRR
jgi:osmotically-inducible protein OsmY